MKRDSRLSSVLHGLLHMADHDGPMTSDQLVQCNGHPSRSCATQEGAGPPATAGGPALDHQGKTCSAEPVNVPVGASLPRSATRTASAAPCSTVSVPSKLLSAVLV